MATLRGVVCHIPNTPLLTGVSPGPSVPLSIERDVLGIAVPGDARGLFGRLHDRRLRRTAGLEVRDLGDTHIEADHAVLRLGLAGPAKTPPVPASARSSSPCDATSGLA